MRNEVIASNKNTDEVHIAGTFAGVMVQRWIAKQTNERFEDSSSWVPGTWICFLRVGECIAAVYLNMEGSCLRSICLFREERSRST